MGCEMKEILYDAKNIEKLEFGVREYKRGFYNGIRMACLNKEEADKVKEYMSNNYPDVSFSVSWLLFDEEANQ